MREITQLQPGVADDAAGGSGPAARHQGSSCVFKVAQLAALHRGALAPRIAGAVEVLDWSDRARWRKNDHRVGVFETFIRSDEEYNPAAVVFRSTGAPLVFRFYSAFKNAKHGNVEGLKDLEVRFFASLEE